MTPSSPAGRPLAEALRPARLDDVLGQPHLIGPEGAISRMVAQGVLGSLILWGPPGTGKTSIARLLAAATNMRFESLSAIFSGVADLKRAFAEAAAARLIEGPTLLFVDEIHRFNRAQQDAFLPVVEDGTITLVGATTENPSFELNGALMSRCRLLILRALDHAALDALLARAEAVAGAPLPLTAEGREALIAGAEGDGRFLLNQAQALSEGGHDAPLDAAGVAAVLQRRPALYDKDGDGHYGIISALHKAVRGSDPQAALYYLARMLEGGEDPRFLARRLVRMASEDVGLADPQALPQALAAAETYRMLGSPEGELALAQACVYLATAPKSNALYRADKAARLAAKASGSVPPPAHIMNAPTKLMKAIGRGAGYRYDHDEPDAFSGQDYWPDGVPAQDFYAPTDRGFERRIAERLAWWQSLREQRRG